MNDADDPNPMRLMGAIHRSFVRVVDGPLRELGFAVGQLVVLVTLRRAGPQAQSQLVRAAKVEQSSMAQLLARMERDGLVERVPDPQDGRSRLVSLTDAAARRLPRAKALMDDTSERALAGFSDKERAQLLGFLRRVHANLEAVEPKD
jgi:DNA-binding MarR family transcriptional regulator